MRFFFFFTDFLLSVFATGMQESFIFVYVKFVSSSFVKSICELYEL